MKALIDKAKTSLPEGTFAVGSGLAVAAITAYGYMWLAFRDRGNSTAVAGLSALWALLFVAGPGLFLPLEQEVGRALAHRRAQGIGGRPLIMRAATVGGIAALVMVAASLATYPILRDKLFHGQGSLVIALIFGLVGYFCLHLSRGVLSGNARFGAYGIMLGAEAVARLLPVIVFAILAVTSAAPYGFALGLAPFVAAPLAMRGQKNLALPGPPAPWSELSVALFYLLAGSVLSQALSYAPLLAANLIHGTSKTEIANFARAFVIARIPILLFLAIQAALLPKLASLRGAGRHDEFRHGVKQLTIVVIGVATLGVAGAWVAGPFVGKILFGAKQFTISNNDLALLALGSGIYIMALTFAQVLIALDGHARAAFAWMFGVVGFIVFSVVATTFRTQVEVSFVIGSGVSTLFMGALLWKRMHGVLPETTAGLVEAIEQDRTVI